MGHLARIGGMSNTQIFFAFKRKSAIPLERLTGRPTSEDNIKKDVNINVWGDKDWFHQGQNKDLCEHRMNMLVS